MKKVKIFIAAPLFNEMERQRNTETKKFLEEIGYDTFLAQDDVGLSYDIFKSEKHKQKIRKNIFNKDVISLVECDIVLILLDGRIPDEGACVELGIGWALRKPCLLFKTDERAMDKYGDNNIMIDGCCGFKTITTFEQLKVALKGISKKTKSEGIF